PPTNGRFAMHPLPRPRLRTAGCLAAATVAAAVTAATVATTANAAATITVAADGSGNYTTIQAAVAAASSGTVLTVKAGTYHGQVSIPSSKSGITLQGA